MRPGLSSLLGCVILAVLASGALTSLPARAAVPVLGPPAPVLRAGEDVRLPLPGLPRGADEVEAYLSLDGGATFPIRLTEERDPGAGTLAFRVPNLPARSARILVRAGGRVDGRRFEADLFATGPFRLSPAAGVPNAVPWADRGLLRRRGDHVRVEWRAEERSPLLTLPPDRVPAGIAPVPPLLGVPLDGDLPLLLAGKLELPAPGPVATKEGLGGEPHPPVPTGHRAGSTCEALPGPLRL